MTVWGLWEGEWAYSTDVSCEHTVSVNALGTIATINVVLKEQMHKCTYVTNCTFKWPLFIEFTLLYRHWLITFLSLGSSV